MALRSYPESSLLVGAAASVWEGSTSSFTIAIGVSSKLASRMLGESEEPLSEVFITDSDVRHIKRKHSQDESLRGQERVTPEDFGLLPAVLNDFDEFDHTDTDKLGNKKYLVAKQFDSRYYVAVIQRGKKKLEIKTFWKKRSPGASC